VLGRLPKFVLFDFDGTLVDSVPTLYRVFDDWLNALPSQSDLLHRESLYSMTIFQIVERVCESSGLAHRSIELERDYFARVSEAYELVGPIEGADHLLRSLRDSGVVLGLVTSAPEKLVEPVLDRLDWQRLFAVLECGESAKMAKPDPAPYRAAIAHLGLSASEGLAIEDSPSGVAAAKGAGLSVLGLDRSGLGEKLIAAGASGVIKHLDEVAHSIDVKNA
jgi:HAD superfamily hydrolase (TIGR01509 family)